MTDGSGPRPFGGVAEDARFAGELVAGAAQGKGESIGFAPLGLVLMAVDLPLSVVGDLATLPWVVTGAADKSPATSPNPEPPTTPTGIDGRQAPKM